MASRTSSIVGWPGPAYGEPAAPTQPVDVNLLVSWGAADLHSGGSMASLLVAGSSADASLAAAATAAI